MKRSVVTIVLAMVLIIAPMNMNQVMAAYSFDTRDFGVKETVEQEDGKRTQYMAELESAEDVDGAYNGEEFVVFLARKSYITSVDGVEWSSPKAVMNDYSINKIIIDESGWFYTVSGTYEVPLLLASKDLIEWKEIKTSFNAYYNYEVYTNADMSYCVGYDNLMKILENGEVVKEVKEGTTAEYSVKRVVRLNGTTFTQESKWDMDKPKASKQMVLASTDGVNYTEVFSVDFDSEGDYSSPGEVFRAGEGVAVYLNGATYYSADGKNWQSGIVRGKQGIVSKGGHFASDSDNMYTSLDGENWHKTQTSSSYKMTYQFYDAVAGDQGIIAISRYKLITSKDGYTWKEVALKGAEGKMHWRVSYALGKYVVQVANSDSTSTLYVSEDLINWQSNVISDDFDIVDAVTWKGQMVAYGRGFNDGRLLISSNGLDWKSVYTHEILIESIAATDKGVLFVDSDDNAYIMSEIGSVERCDIGGEKPSMVYASKGVGYILAWTGHDNEKDIYKNTGNEWTKVNTITMDGRGSSSVAINNDASISASRFDLNEMVLLGANGDWQRLDTINEHSSYFTNYESLIYGNKVVTIGYLTMAGRADTYYGLSVVNTDPVKITIDGELLMGMDVPPTVVAGRTLMPVRQFFEAIGSAVSWDSTTKTVTIANSKDTVKVQINSATAYVNGAAHSLDVPATIVDGRTMVPVRFISEAMGYGVDWESDSRTVMVTVK